MFVRLFDVFISLLFWYLGILTMLVRHDILFHLFIFGRHYIVTRLMNTQPVCFINVLIREWLLIFHSLYPVYFPNIKIFEFAYDNHDIACPPVWCIHFSSVLWLWYKKIYSGMISYFTHLYLVDIICITTDEMNGQSASSMSCSRRGFVFCHSAYPVCY